MSQVTDDLSVRDEPQQPGGQQPVAPRLVWWRELGLAVLLYLVYAHSRDLHGAGAGRAGVTERARRDGRSLGHLERILHVDVEPAVQRLVLPYHWLVRLLNGYYGGMHLVLTAVVFITLLVKAPAVFRYWRAVLFTATFVGVLGFVAFPAMSPRLLAPPYQLVDTLHVYGGLWSYQNGTMEHIADPYAAIPSLHLVWASWVACVLWSTGMRWLRVFAVAHVSITVFVVMATGNHFLLDVLAGVTTFLLGWAIVVTARRLRGSRADRHPRRRRTPETPG